MMLTIAEALVQAGYLLGDASGDTPELDARLLLCEVLQCSAAYLHTWPEKNLSEAHSQKYLALLEKRRQGIPVAHLIGRQGFWSLELKVAPCTLIPRSDTERLVEVALGLEMPGEASLLDLGTGTGAIALALAKERGGWQILGVDYDNEIVQLAQGNARLNHIENARFMTSDWFTGLGDQRYHMIVSNPPYIDAEDAHLGQGDLRFEANSALVSGEQGLADLGHIVAQAPAYLESDGWLVLEHGYDQGESVRTLLVEAGFSAVASHHDLGGNERVSCGRWV